MKLLLSMILNRSRDRRWWELRTSEGDPPDERSYVYTRLTDLLTVVRGRLYKFKGHDETHS